MQSLAVPASVEWEIKPYFTCRVGLFFSALRSETKTTGLQSGELLFRTTEFRDLAGDAHHVIDYSTGVGSVLGFEINLRDKLFLDYYDSSTSNFGFEYVSLRYRF